MIRTIALIAFLVLGGAVLAQNVGPIGGNRSLIGPSPRAASGRIGTGGPPPSGCGASQLDWSVSTGCNLVWAGH